MDPLENEYNNNVELTEKELVNLEKRTQILLNEGNQAFNRFISSYDALIKKIISLFQIFLVLISIEIGVVTFHFQNGFGLSDCSLYFGILAMLSGFFSFMILIYLFLPKSMKDISIFEEGRFNELCDLDSFELLSDFLYQMKDSYQSVVPTYIRVTFWFYSAYSLIIVMVISYIIFIICLRM